MRKRRSALPPFMAALCDLSRKGEPMTIQRKMKLKADLLLLASLIGVLLGSLYLYYFAIERLSVSPYGALTLIVIGGVSLFMYLWSRSARSECPGCGHRFALGWGASYVDLHKAPSACPNCGFHFVGTTKESAQ